MNWEDVRIFLAASRAGSLTRAGAALGVEHTTVARRIEALEAELGARLFDRSRRGLTLTDAGREVLPRAEAAARGMAEIERLAGTFDANAVGRVILATSTVLATEFVVPLLATLQELHPRIDVVVRVNRRLLSLEEREADLALRMVFGDRDPAEKDTIVAKVATVDLGLFASEAYLAAHGTFDLDRLRDHRLIRYCVPEEPGGAWLRARTDESSTAFELDDMASARDSCVAGLGLAVLPHFYGASAGLRCLASGCESARLYIGVHPDLRRVPRVAAVYACLKASVEARLDTLERDPPHKETRALAGE